MDGIIYGVRCRCNGKWYIGQTVNYKQRKHNHLRSARHISDGCIFHAAIRKYGADSFEWVVLESNIKTHDELNEREKYWIQEKNSLLPNGYNMNAGGNGTANHRKNFVPWNKGKTGCYTEEALRRMSERLKGRRVSEEQRKKISATLTGRHLSEETIRKRSAALKGHACPESARQRIAAAKFKPVLMFNRDGVFISEFPSIKDAAVHIGD